MNFQSVSDVSAAPPIAEEGQCPGQLAGTKPGNTQPSDSRLYVPYCLIMRRVICVALNAVGKQIDMPIKKARRKKLSNAYVCVREGKPFIFFNS